MPLREFLFRHPLRPNISSNRGLQRHDNGVVLNAVTILFFGIYEVPLIVRITTKGFAIVPIQTRGAGELIGALGIPSLSPTLPG